MKLHDDAVHVWRVELDRVEPATLSADERARAARFARDIDRARFVASRTALRRVLGDYLGYAAELVSFRYGARGKPSLDLEPAPLDFNLSHSRGVALVAVARARAVGVDVERHRAVDPDALAASCFSPAEQRALAAIAPRDRLAAFFRGWTRKEALIKAHGDGLYLPLDRFTVSLDDTVHVSIDTPGFTIRSLSVGHDTSAALAIVGAPPSISWFDFNSS